MEHYVTKTKTGKTITNIEFDGTYDLLDYIKANSLKGAHSKEPREESFCSFTWDETLKMLEYGWPEGDKEIDLKVKSLEGMFQVDAEIPCIDYDVTGDYIDVGRYLEGIPEVYGYFDTQEAKKDEINIIVNTTSSWNITQDQIYNKGAVIINLLDMLQKQYHTVNLQFIWYAQNNYSLYGEKTGYICMKLNLDLHNTFSKDAITFIVANTGYSRRCMFSLYEIAANVPECGSYGIVETYEEYNHDTTIYIPELMNNALAYSCKTIEGAKGEIEKIMNSLKEMN